jgi:hypothetical protein
VHVAQEDLAIVDRRETVDQRRAPEAQRLHLGAGEYDPALECVEDGVVVTRLAVLRDQLAASVTVARQPVGCAHLVILADAAASREYL